MYLTTAQSLHLSAVLQVLTEPGHSADSLRLHLVEPIARLLGANVVASLVWDPTADRFGRGVCARADLAHLRAYEATHQFADPLPQLLQPWRYPKRVSQVMPQHELVKTDFFNQFLSPGQMYWGVNLYAHQGNTELGDLRIWRARSKGDFDDHEMAALHLIYPSLVQALARTGNTKGVGIGKPGAAQLTWQSSEQGADLIAWLTPELSASLAVNGTLSPREAQVVQLVAQGLCDKGIARHTGLAYSTVRTYLTQALRKTGCANRKALIGRVCSLQ